MPQWTSYLLLLIPTGLFVLLIVLMFRLLKELAKDLRSYLRDRLD